MQDQKKARGFSKAPNVEAQAATRSNTTAPDAQSVMDKLDAAAKPVKVIHGANDGEFNLVGQKVSAVRASLVDAFNIPGDALAFVNGEQVDANFVLVENCTLEFVKQAGVKG